MKHEAYHRLFTLAAVLAAGSLPVWSQSLEELHRTLDLRLELPAAMARSKSALAAGNPKIDPMLRSLAASAQSKSINIASAEARGMDIPVDAGRIGVVAAATSEAEVDALRRRIRDEGGTVVAVVDSAVLARLPVNAIDRLGSEQALEYLSPQEMLSLPPAPRAAAAESPAAQGVLLTKANLLHQRGTRGKGIKVGILDFGFSRYQKLQAAGLLPAPKAVKCFGKDAGWDRGDTGEVHGTACAEIIHAMAPDADLYIASVGTGDGSGPPDEIIQAAMWLADQHVDIISFSGGGRVGPHNGTSLLDRLVAEVVKRGVLWVNAAGNEGDSHWSGMTELNPDKLVMAGDKPFILLQAVGPRVEVIVTWDDWGPNPLAPSSTQDFDAFLARIDAAGNAELVPQPQPPTAQNGHQAPVEIVAADAKPGERLALFILATRVDHPVRMHVYYKTGGKADAMVPHSVEGSIGIPATSPNALAVGAVNIADVRLEPFSSQGPTDDGRAKPEVSGPDGVTSAAYQAAFHGTSAACPHVAGFAALVTQMRGHLQPAELSRIITAATTELADNRGAGHGLIDARKLGTGSNTSSGRAPRIPDAVLRAAREDNPLGVKLVVGRPEYRVGDGLKIGYRVNRDAYCLLLHHSSEGEFTFLEPQAGGELRLAAGERYAYPPAETTIRITGPPGTDEVGLICSATPIQWDMLTDADMDALSVNVARYQVKQ